MTSRAQKAEVHPVLLRKVLVVQAAMEVAGMPMKIVSQVRTAEEQNALFQVGRRGKPGEKIVTNADGFDNKSNHQAKNDGYGHAVDCAFFVNGKITWEVPDSWWAAYGALAVACGLTWGGNWKSFRDRPHVELPLIV